MNVFSWHKYYSEEIPIGVFKNESVEVSGSGKEHEDLI